MCVYVQWNSDVGIRIRLMHIVLLLDMIYVTKTVFFCFCFLNFS